MERKSGDDQRMLSRVVSILTNMAVKWVIVALVTSSLVQAVIGSRLNIDAPAIVKGMWFYMTSPPLLYLGLYLAGWWSATAALRYTDRLDGATSLLEQDRLRCILSQTRWSRWGVFPDWFRRREHNRANRALETAGFPPTTPAVPVPDDPCTHERKRGAAYFAVIEVLIRRLGYEAAKSASPLIHRALVGKAKVAVRGQADTRARSAASASDAAGTEKLKRRRSRSREKGTPT
jgi:hypothetical protein